MPKISKRDIKPELRELDENQLKIFVKQMEKERV